MSDNDAKSLRKQIRNVLQEVGKEEFIKDTKDAIYKQTLETMNQRLDSIDKYCREELQRQDKRSKTVQSFVVNEVVNRVQQDLFRANCMLDAVVEVITESGLPIDDFHNKVKDRIPLIEERRKKESDEAMKVEMERRVKEEQEKKAATEQQPQESSPKAE